MPLRLRQQRLNHRPLLISQIRRVPPLAHHPSTLADHPNKITPTHRR
jgi:hypothetical protein